MGKDHDYTMSSEFDIQSIKPISSAARQVFTVSIPSNMKLDMNLFSVETDQSKMNKAMTTNLIYYIAKDHETMRTISALLYHHNYGSLEFKQRTEYYKSIPTI